MLYVFSHLWVWLVCAFLVGALVGWKACGTRRA